MKLFFLKLVYIIATIIMLYLCKILPEQLAMQSRTLKFESQSLTKNLVSVNYYAAFIQ